MAVGVCAAVSILRTKTTGGRMGVYDVLKVFAGAGLRKMVLWCLAVLAIQIPGLAQTPYHEVKLLAGNGSASANFGRAVTLRGNTAVVGAYGATYQGYPGSGLAYVYGFDGTNWVERVRLSPPDPALGGCFGNSVSLSGDRIALGAYSDDDKGSMSGSVYVFEREGTNWVQKAKLLASDGRDMDRFGVSVAVDSNRIAVGSYKYNGSRGSYCGAVYVYDLVGTNWIERAELIPADAAALDMFGASLALGRDRLVAGASNHDAKGTNAGAAYVYVLEGTNWVQQAKLTPSDAEGTNYFGASVAMNGDRVVIGASGDNDQGLNSGSAYVFELSGTNWIERAKLKASDGCATNFFGAQCDIEGNRLAIDAYGDKSYATNGGSVYLFDFDGTNWIQRAKLVPPDAGVNALFGYPLSVSGDMLLLGASGDATLGIGAGAAYVFSGLGTSPLTALDSSVVVSVGSPKDVSLPFLANGQLLSFDVLESPAHGTLQTYQSATGDTRYPWRFRYTPAAGFSGIDTLVWRAVDGTNVSNTATCRLDVADVAPTVGNSSISGNGGSTLTAILSSTDPDGAAQTNTYILVTPPSHGIVQMPSPATGRIAYAYYIPENSFSGVDTFSWCVCDGIKTSGVATVTVTVTAVAPVPLSQTVVGQTNTPLVIRPLYSGGAGYVCQIVKVGGPVNGVLTTNGAAFVYTPNNNFTGADQFNWQLICSNAVAGISNTAVVTCSIVVKGGTTVSDWPQWRFDESRTAQSPHVLPSQLSLLWRRDLPVVQGAYGWYSDLEYYKPVQLGKTLFVPVGASDCLAAYDTDSGALKWKYYTSGALRRPAAAARLESGTNVVVFGAEDGYVYCLNGADGGELWKFRAAPNEKKAMCFGRLGSIWPVYGSPVVSSGVVYCTAGFLPSQGLYSYALDLATGSVIWRNDGQLLMDSPYHSAIGPLTVSSDHSLLYGASSGRTAPWALRLTNGVFAGYGTGGNRFSADGNGYGGVAIRLGNATWPSRQITDVQMVSAGGDTFTPAGVGALGVSGTVGSMLAGDGKLFVATVQGSIYCFGAAAGPTNIYLNSPVTPVATNDVWTVAASNMLSRADLKQGLALVWGVGSGRLVEELAKQASGLMVVACDPDPVKLRAIRVKMDAAGWSGARVSTLQGNPLDCGFAPYQAALIASEDAGVAGIGAGSNFVKMAYKCTRPLGGEIWLPVMNGQYTALSTLLAGAGLPLCSNQVSYAVEQLGGYSGIGADCFMRIRRTGFPDEGVQLKPPFRVVAFGEEYSYNIASLNLQLSPAPQRGTKSGRDIYTWLPLTASPPGYEPGGQTNVAGTVASMPGVMENVVYGGSEVAPAISVYGDCGNASSYGKLNVNPGKTAAVYESSTNFWGVWGIADRGGCSWNWHKERSLVWDGVLAMSGGDSGCGCGTALGLNATEFAAVHSDDEETGVTYYLERSRRYVQDRPARRIGINFGGVSDVYVAEEKMLWVHHPAVNGEGALIPVSYSGDVRNVYHHSAQIERTQDEFRGWVSASQVTGMDGLSVHLASVPVVLMTATTPVIDGSLTDSCWDGREELTLNVPNDGYNFAARNAGNTCRVAFRYDDTNLYVAARMKAKLSGGTTGKYMMMSIRGRDSRPVNAYWRDTWLESASLAMTESYRSSYGISTNSWRGGLATVDNADGTKTIGCEICIPWAALESMGIVRDRMLINLDLCGAALNGHGGWGNASSGVDWSDQFYFQRPLVANLTPVWLDSAKGEATHLQPYTVKLYFAEMEDKKAGERVFDVKLQGALSIAGLDVYGEAGARRELIKTFSNIMIADRLNIDFVRHAGEPMLSGVELVASPTNVPSLPPVAVIDADIVSGSAPLTVTLDGKSSYSPDGQIVDCAWEFGDGRLGKGGKATHVFAEPGVYNVGLLVVDNHGRTAATNRVITVSAGQPAAFVSRIRSSGGDFTNLSSWEAAVRSDLCSTTKVFRVSSIETYQSTGDDGTAVVFSGGATGVLRWVATNCVPPVAAVTGVGGTGTVMVGTVTTAGGRTFSVSDTGSASSSLVFRVSDRGSYSASADDGRMVTFSGGGTGFLRHMNTSNVVYITECSGAINAGPVLCPSGSFAVSDGGCPVISVVAECYNDWPAGLNDSALKPSGWITDIRHAPVVRAAAGHRHSGKLRNGLGNYTGFALNGDLGVYNQGTPAYAGIEGVIAGGAIYTGPEATVNRSLCAGWISAFGHWTMAANSVAAGMGQRYDISYSHYYNVTAGTFSDAYGNLLVNCLARNVPAYGVAATRAYCVSPDGSSTNVTYTENDLGGNIAGGTAAFVDAAGGDYHLSVYDVSAVGGAGGPGLGADIDGEARGGSRFDVGADQSVVNHAPYFASAPCASGIAVAGVSAHLSVVPGDMDNDTLVCTWIFGDGQSGSGTNVSHVYDQAGDYVAQVVVSDGMLARTGTVALSVLNGYATAEKMPVTVSGYSRSEQLTNFPMLIVVSNNVDGSGFGYGRFASAAGRDLRFYDATETVELPHEIEQWNTNGASYVWVLVPVVSNGASIWAAWGDTNAAVATVSYRTNGAVWSGGFDLVQHMGDTGGGGVRDSGMANRAGTVSGTYAWQSDSIAGSALRMSGANDTILLGSGIPLNGTYTISAWFKNLQGSSNWRTLARGSGLHHLALVEQGSARLGYYDNTLNTFVAVAPQCNLAPVAGWQQITVVADGSVSKYYLNGVYQGAAAARSVSDLQAIGNYQGGGQKWSEYLDEFRLENVNRSSNWVWASWLNIASNRQFLGIGTVRAAAHVDMYGIPDEWKIAHFGSASATGSGGLEDPDGDGLNNYAEWRAGTDPTDDRSGLAVSRIDAAVQGGGYTNAMVLQWGSVTGRVYSVDCSTGLLSGFTIKAASNIVATPPVNTRTVQVDQASLRFFRISIE